MRLKDKVIVVSGAASGLGRALCPMLAAEGAVLGLLDRNGPGVEQVAAALEAAGARCVWATADVRQRKETNNAIDALTAQLGPVDVLLASTGITGVTLVDDLNVDLVEDIIRTNLLGVIYQIEAVLPDMLVRKSGHIVAISSLAGVLGLPFHGAYCSSKAGLASFLESMRPCLSQRGVRVTTIFPGFIRTPMLETLLSATGVRVPFKLLEPEQAARHVFKAVLRQRREAHFPFVTSWLAWYAKFLPPFLYDWVMNRIAARIYPAH